MIGKRVSNMQMNSRHWARFKRRQIETIGNLRIFIMCIPLVNSQYCDTYTYITFGQGNDNTLQTAMEFLTWYFLLDFLENYASTRYDSMDNFYVLKAKILLLHILHGGT